MIRVGVAGAAGRMGVAACAAIEAAADLELAGRADPALGAELASILGRCDVVVDFTTPTRRSRTPAPASRRACTW